MAKKNILPLHWQLIVDRFKDEHGSCVPFLGPDVNAPYDGYTGFPSNHEIAFTLLKEIIGLTQEERDSLAHATFHEYLQPLKDLTRIGMDDLARVALHYQYASGEEYLIQRLRELRNDAEQEPSLLLRLIADQKFHMIATTNYDRLMEKALENKCMVVSQPAIDQGVISQQVLQDNLFSHTPEKDGPILYKFCGSFVNGSGTMSIEVGGEEGAVSLTGEQRLSLLTNMRERISLSEFQDILAFFDINYEDLPSPALKDKMRELILEIERRQQIEALIDRLKRIPRPGVNWDVTDQKSDTQTEATNGRPKRPVFPEHVIITEEDFLSVLTNVGSQDARRIPQRLQARLNSSSLLLFLGFRLEGWEFRTLFKTLIENQEAKSDRKLIAIQKEPSDFWAEFWERKGVVCYDLDPAGFAQQLQGRMQ